jgi:isopenicillin N synthase-like dioxygenase
MSFSSIPILDLSHAKDPSTKAQFLKELRHALLEVGFLYLKNVGIPDELTQAVIREGVQFFDLPMEEKFVTPAINTIYPHSTTSSLTICKM